MWLSCKDISTSNSFSAEKKASITAVVLLLKKKPKQKPVLQIFCKYNIKYRCTAIVLI